MVEAVPDWNTLYEHDEFAPDEPEPFLLSAVSRPTMTSDGASCVLDIGCGAGRHLVWLAEQGFEVFGVDDASRALERSRARLHAAGAVARLVRGDFVSLPFTGDSFDMVVAIHALYHGDQAALRRALSEVARVLRDGGLLVATFLSTLTWKYGLGVQVEPFTYVQPEGPERGIPHHYVTAEMLVDYLAAFNVETMRLDELTDQQGRRHCHWQVACVRTGR